MDARLDIGLTFSDYSEKVADIHVEFSDLDPKDLPPEPEYLEAGLLLIDAFIAYIDAHDVWDRCFDSPNCTNDDIESELQDLWATASGKLDDAEAYFDP